MLNPIPSDIQEKIRSILDGSFQRESYGDELITRVCLGAFRALQHDGCLDDRDYLELVKRTKAEGFSFLSSSLPALGKAFDKGLATGSFRIPDAFGRHRRNGIKSRLPKFMGSHIAKVFNHDGSLRNDYCIRAVRAVRQVCYYAYKADVPCAPHKEVQVVRDFVETECVLAKFVEDASASGGVFSSSSSGIPDDPILALGAKLVGSIFSDFQISNLRPKQGPGATSDVSLSQKWDSRVDLSSTWNLTGAPGRRLELFGTFRWFNPSHALSDLEAVVPWDPWSGWLKPAVRDRAKVLLVPKDSRGPRLISAEPCFSQYIQGGIQRYMYDKLERNPLTGGRVNFTDQTVNQKLALEGSSSGEYSTLDLKEASDRVSMRLVDLLFSESGELRLALNAVRTSETCLPQDQGVTNPKDGSYVLPLVKHAPMGSAVCFPVMATCIWAILVSGFRALGLSLSDGVDRVYVYGDDIIVPSALHDVAIKLLERYGLVVNQSKSFRGAGFLESCGCDAFFGQEVTPVRLRCLTDLVDPHRSTSTVKRRVCQKFYVSSVAHANELYESGYAHTGQYWESLARLFGTVPCVPPDSGLVGITSPYEADWSIKDGYLSAYRVKQVSTCYPTRPWNHLRRISSSIGTANEIAFGDYSLPRDWTLKKVRVRRDRLRAGKVPKWVTDLGFPV